ncbi:MAG: 50S ribosomal protein L35 [Gammaproteobacteria bacterium]|nr:50S ribosomal protein L35 [Gammaproteobacteria bacterium]
MPKLKTRRGAAKRFNRTGTGKLRHRQAHRSHILTKKRTKRKRQLRGMAEFHPGDVKAVARQLPYG